MPSHYLNQCRIISKIKIELRHISFRKVTNYRLLIVGHFVSASMVQWAWNIWFRLSYIAMNLSNALGFLSFYVLNFQTEQKHTYAFYIIPPHWDGRGRWNQFLCNSRTHLFYIVNIMGADVLATQWARTVATMISTMLNRICSVPAR